MGCPLQLLALLMPVKCAGKILRPIREKKTDKEKRKII